ncbi:MAG: ProQ/FINO family protein, partial [Leptothrix sp. (in: b-proteobacteria)]
MSQIETPATDALPTDPAAPHPVAVDAADSAPDAAAPAPVAVAVAEAEAAVAAETAAAAEADIAADAAAESADDAGDDARQDSATEGAEAAPAVKRVDPGPALKALFPALFAGAAKPVKLRIQVDIQARAPGQFTKPALSAFLRRHTGSTGYLIALSKAQTRFDLDGEPAGELSDEHRQAALDELKRRRALSDERRALEDQQRRNRAQLLADFGTTTLTRPNFCALKGVVEDQLDGLLDLARREADAWASQRPPQRDARGPRRDPA